MSIKQTFLAASKICFAGNLHQHELRFIISVFASLKTSPHAWLENIYTHSNILLKISSKDLGSENSICLKISLPHRLHSDWHHEIFKGSLFLVENWIREKSFAIFICRTQKKNHFSMDLRGRKYLNIQRKLLKSTKALNSIRTLALNQRNNVSTENHNS